ncbi:transcriptional regulator [Azorhizobium caulinodans ORS 571]|uniref:Transcriptional regulator n=1 Tax=Azorhizobium caulinodans (strain ATCC 43989 / DSM 5975 / JCM 20966 / LMG 6465 / NBRC 14845 / NCIMB 13405 / ORS 571) TaxID=438753 RepID=A8IAE4_AZOC5|nr:LysR family transcriptional regulator [Azorhizobium caulinodans]BAF88496.1 transcriptional regulator [Azorhizobium caulinodans ORS 571]
MRAMLHHDLQSLRLFVAVCETRSLSKAAERMNLALSAASRRLRLLEEEAGMPLVRRLPHGVEPTMAGQTALSYAQSVLMLADRYVAGLADHRSGARGRVRVSASSSALVERLATDLADFAKRHPDIRIDLEEQPTADTIAAVTRKQADLGVIVRGQAVEGLTLLPYSTDRLSVVVRSDHPLADRAAVAFSDLLDEDFVALEAGTAVNRLVMERARELGRFLKVRVQVRSFEVMCQMVHHGLGIGILPEAALRPLATALGLTLVRLEETWAAREIAICLRENEELPSATRRLLDELLTS